MHSLLKPSAALVAFETIEQDEADAHTKLERVAVATFPFKTTGYSPAKYTLVVPVLSQPHCPFIKVDPIGQQ